MNTFDQFTNKYSLSKTLRFELKPVGKTLEKMKTNLEYDPDLQTFLKDQKIEDAYQAFKPFIDKIHEEFITASLESEEAKRVDFSEYFDAYKQAKDDKGEESLRKKIGELYKIGEEKIKDTYKCGWKWNKGEKNLDKQHKLDWKVGGKEKNGTEIMVSPDILYAAAAVAGEAGEGGLDENEIKKHLKAFDGFFTYFSGFNENRANYYEVKSEKATAVATRIIHENLPKFCDNVLFFEERKAEYLGAYDFLKNQGKLTQIKDAESKQMIEVAAIDKDYFAISFFNTCLSQSQIENYNKVIGHYNLLINLYNQARIAEEKNAVNAVKRERAFKKLPHFKTIYKQIGCGKKKSLFDKLEYDKESNIQEKDKKRQEAGEILSVERLLETAAEAGKKYFSNKEDSIEVKTVPQFVDWLQGNSGDWSGFYWTNKAVNTISNKYFASWYAIFGKIKDASEKYDTVATYNEKREQQIKLRDAVELKGLFELLDQSVDTNIEQWWENFFRKSVWEKPEAKEMREEEKKELEQWEKRMEKIKEAKSPSEALIQLFYLDINEHAQAFINESKNILALEKNYKENEESKRKIKAWMEEARSVNAMLRYFLVREGKIKGDTLNSELVNLVKMLTDGENDEVNWFRWYDLLRNYLTRKPEEDAKENKLKLNFECSTLLTGWSDGQEKSKKSVILRNGERYFLGILKKSSLFDTGKENNLVYTDHFDDEESGRLILANLKFQTLAGRGFIRDYGSSYGTMGQEEPLKAVVSLQELIKRQYLTKYPPLEEIAHKTYTNKKEFDKDVQSVLKKCYICEFYPVNWSAVQRYVEEGSIYLFEISHKKSNLQHAYWKSIFWDQSPHQLSGKGEVFYRKPAIGQKEIKKGYTDKPWVIEGKRFTSNAALENDQEASATDGKSFFFHCSVKLNYKAIESKYALGEIKASVNKYLPNYEGIQFLGLDRGEKHLVYYALVDCNGNMIDQGSLNVDFEDRDGKPRSIKKIKQVYNENTKKWEPKEVECKNYNDLLDVAASNRDEARKTWRVIGNIKNLKEGYVSQVVHEVVKKVTSQPTFVVLEDLSTSFKRGRQKIEKSVYQNFELALAKKLNFVVDKKANPGEIGSVTRALQLTPPVQNYGDIENKKQVGIMLYTRANYTSQTDPITGWRKTIYLKSGPEETTYTKDGKIKSESVRDQIQKSFTDIGFDGKDYYFTYTDRNTEKEWKLWSGKDGQDPVRYHGKRTKDKNVWKTECITIKEKLDKIFEGFDKGRSLYTQIYDEKKEIAKCDDDHGAWESLRFVIDVIQQIRNSGGENITANNPDDDNFLLSPVRDENGSHFDSRNVDKNDKIKPRDADANGAFNIARKGVIMNAHIRQWVKDGSKKGSGKNKKSDDLDLFVSDAEWDLWLNKREEWEKKLSYFASRSAKEKEKKEKKK